ncbi:hypothetical protein KIN20_007497 [Parelaphostrongylus tenuis]|uniref:Uncharacterized protein n=1 Tax=Parelaphostrongylus tenuis TaxID=148309 RepID=A0AAD5MPS8_PARTN|nr:hypothetical protein KIN20_007497 [Parelaphostrongylus tenuis]
MSPSDFDRFYDEETMMKKEHHRQSFRGDADVEKKAGDISNGMNRNEYTSMCPASADVYAQRAAFSRNSSLYPDEHRSNRGYLNDSRRIDFCTLQMSQVGTYRATSAAIPTPASRLQIYRAESSWQNFQDLPLHSVGTGSKSPRCQSDQRRALPSSRLSREDGESLNIIREFTYIHRNGSIDGFPPLRNALKLLKTSCSHYWVPLINLHLSEVEVVMCGETPVLVWKGNEDSD